MVRKTQVTFDVTESEPAVINVVDSPSASIKGDSEESSIYDGTFF